MAQKGLLKYALNKDKTDNIKYQKDGSDDSDNDQDFSKFGSKNVQQREKLARAKELEDLKA